MRARPPWPRRCSFAAGCVSAAGGLSTTRTYGLRSRPTIEHELGRSVSLTPLSFAFDETRITLLDTPGYADFVGELRAGLRAADAALFVWRPRRHRCRHHLSVAGMRGGRDAPCGGRHQTRPGQHRLRRGSGLVPAGLRRGHPTDVPADAGRRRIGVGGSSGCSPRRSTTTPAGPATRAPPRPQHQELIEAGAVRSHRGHHHRVRGRDPDGAVPGRRRAGHRRCSSTTSRRPSPADTSTRCCPVALRRMQPSASWRCSN